MAYVRSGVTIRAARRAVVPFVPVSSECFEARQPDNAGAHAAAAVSKRADTVAGQPGHSGAPASFVSFEKAAAESGRSGRTGAFRAAVAARAKGLICMLLAIMTVFAIVSAIAPAPAYALNEARASWRILTTKNFEIYYHNRDDEFAKAAGRIAENALADISKQLAVKDIPARIPLVLYDFSDSPYGFTNILQNKMWVSIAQPEAAELCDRTWIDTIIRHELTHYIMGIKFDRKLRLGTGRIIGWGLTPMWFIEGVAQRMESSWNSIKDSAVRTALLSKTFLDLRELQIFYFFNYHGRRLGYHIGNSLVNFMAEKFGPDCIPKIIEETRYTINGFYRAVRRVTKHDIGEIFKMWQEENSKKYQAQVAGKKSIRDYNKPWTAFSGLNVSPRFDCSQKSVYYLSNQGRDARRMSLFVSDLAGGGQKKLIENVEENYFVDGECRFILFARKTFDRYDNLRSDIFRYDVKTREVGRVTRWMKVANPVYDYRDDTIFAILQDAGSTNVCRIDKNGHIVERITDKKQDSAIYELHAPAGAECGKNGGGYLFANYFENGRFSVAFISVDRASKAYGKVVPLAFFDGMILKPAAFYEGDGRYRVMFIKDEGGIFNVHSFKLKINDDATFEATGHVKLTDLRESVLDFDYNPALGKLAVVTQTSGGSEITLLDEKGVYCLASDGGACSRDLQPAAAAYSDAAAIASGAGTKGDASKEKKAASSKKRRRSSKKDAGPDAAPAIIEDISLNVDPSLSPAAPLKLTVRPEGASASNGFATLSTEECRIRGYQNRMKLEYVIPMVGSQSSRSLYGVQGRLADPINRHVFDFQALLGEGSYRNLNATYAYRGFEPTVGILAYDIVRDLREGVLENLKGTDLFMNWRIFDSNITASVFNREISANSISPLLVARNAALSTGENLDRGYSLKFTQFRGENTVDSDIHPLNAHYFMGYHQNSAGRFKSFYQYRVNRFDVSKWMLISEKLKNTIKLRVYGGEAFGDYDFQIGGYNDLRGYSSLTLLGKKSLGYTVEYSHSGFSEPIKLKMFTINRVYPAIFFDAAAAYNDASKRKFYRSAGFELRARLLLFKKTPIIGRTGVAKRLDADKSHEFYSAFELRF